MSYDRDDLGYDLGYDSEPTARPQSKPIQIAFPEQGSLTYQMQDNKAGGANQKPITPFKFGPTLDFNIFGTVRGNKGDKAPGEGDWVFMADTAKANDGFNGTWWPPVKQDAAPPANAAPDAGKKDDKPADPGPTKDNTTGYSTEGLTDKNQVTITYKVGEEKKSKVVSVDEGLKLSPDFAKAYADPAQKTKMWPAAKAATPDKTAGYKHVATGGDKKDAAPVKSTMFIDNLPKGQEEGAASVLKKFGDKKEEAGTYMRLFPYPTKNTFHGSPTDLKQAQADWKTNLEKKDLPTLRHEMREKDLERDKGVAQGLGIPADVWLRRKQAEGKIDWKLDSYPKDWKDVKTGPGGLTVTDNWDVPKAMKADAAEQDGLSKIDKPKKGEPTQRIEAYEKQTQRVQIKQTWSANMMKENGWTQEQCNGVWDKMEAKVQLSKKEPSEVAGYFFAAPDAKAPPAGKFEYDADQKKAGLPSKFTDAKIDPQSFFAANPPPVDPKEREKYYAKLGATDTNLQQEYRDGNATGWLVASRNAGVKVEDAYAEAKKNKLIDPKTEVPKEWPKGDVSSYQPRPIGAYMTPDQVKESQAGLVAYKAGVYPGTKLNPDAKVKAPSIGGMPIRFDQPLPAYDAATPYEPLTASAIEVHGKEWGVAKPDQQAKGQPGLKLAGADAPTVTPTKAGGDVVPPELKDSPWAAVFAKHLPGAMKVVDAIYDGEGKGGPSATSAAALKDENWSLPGATASGSGGDTKVEDGLSLERNRMRSMGYTDSSGTYHGFSDKEIAEYQDSHSGRSLDQIQGTFSAPKGKSWDEVDPKDKEAAVKKERGDQKVYKTALDDEKGRMVSMGFTEPEATEYQRQHPGRSKADLDKTFPLRDTAGDPISKKDQDLKVGATRTAMRETMIDDGAKALMRLDPKLTPRNARLMSEQLYRERAGKGADPDAANLDGMIGSRKDVESDLHFMSENPDRVGLLKGRTSTYQLNRYYEDARAKAKGDNKLEKMFGPTEKGHENLNLFAASRGVDMNDPSSIEEFRNKGLDKEGLTAFHDTYKEADKGKPENKDRTKLIQQFNDMPGSGDIKKMPDFHAIKGLDPKEAARFEANYLMDDRKHDWQLTKDKQDHEWALGAEKRQEAREMAKSKRDQSFQLAFAAVQHEMQKDQATHQAMLNFTTQLISSTIGKMQDATLKKIEQMDQLTAQLVLQSQLSGKDILLAQFGRGGGARG